MSNLTIYRPVNQQFVQYPHWIAQAKEFSLDEAGLLLIILSFKDYLSKSSLVNFTRDGKRAIDTAWKGLIQKGILVVKSFKSAENRFAWSYTVNLGKVSMVSPQKTVVNYAEIAHKYGVSEDIARAIPAASLPNITIEPINKDGTRRKGQKGVPNCQNDFRKVSFSKQILLKKRLYKRGFSFRISTTTAFFVSSGAWYLLYRRHLF